MTWREASTSTVIVKAIRPDPVVGRRRKTGEVVRFLLLDLFQRACTFSSRPRVERNDVFASWKSLFFYHCTDTISFAPLKSQGVDSRLNHIREKTVADAPPPCSPKSIYVLAKLVRQPPTERLEHELMCRIKLGIVPLCDSAFADIKSKVTVDNIVDEVFSWVTAG